MNFHVILSEDTVALIAMVLLTIIIGGSASLYRRYQEKKQRRGLKNYYLRYCNQ